MIMSKLGFSGAGKFAAISLAIAAAVAMPLSASARGWGGHGHHGGDHGSYEGHDGGYRRHGGHWSGGRWIAGAIVTGAVVGLIADALRPEREYYDRPVVYGPPRRSVVYEYGEPVVTRRFVQTRTVVYEDPYPTRYVRDDGYDDDDGE
jgi:hypothetical protein